MKDNNSNGNGTIKATVLHPFAKKAVISVSTTNTQNVGSVFNYEGQQFNVLTDEQGNPWFPGNLVAKILGYANPQKAIRDHVDEEDKRTERIVHPFGGGQDTIIINESGLYSLILKSKLPSAKKFKRWVISEVLPSIRKTGSYSTKPMSLVEMFSFQAKINEEYYRKMLALEEKTDDHSSRLTA